MITEIRKGRSFLKENQALWESIAKKFNGRGLQGISTVCGDVVDW
ncbi:DUF3693 domain-containing protein [Vibrio sp. TBV020]